MTRRRAVSWGGLVLALALTACAAPAPEPTPEPEATTKLDCSGSGSPTVILESGLDTPYQTFSGLMIAVSEVTTVCSYNRPGVGVSPALPSDSPDPSPGLHADLLKELLTANEIDAPYVLLGWSYGGLVVQAFARRYADELAGVVLEDSSASEQFTDPEWAEGMEGLSEGGRPIDFDQTVADVADVTMTGIPLIVLTAAAEANDPYWESWIAMHDRLASLSDDAVHVVAPESYHAMHEYVDELVAAAVLEVVEAVRSGGPLAPCDDRFGPLGGECR